MQMKNLLPVKFFMWPWNNRKGNGVENTVLRIADREAACQLGLLLGKKMAECEHLGLQLVALHQENQKLQQENEDLREQAEMHKEADATT